MSRPHSWARGAPGIIALDRATDRAAPARKVAKVMLGRCPELGGAAGFCGAGSGPPAAEGARTRNRRRLHSDGWQTGDRRRQGAGSGITQTGRVGQRLRRLPRPGEVVRIPRMDECRGSLLVGRMAAGRASRGGQVSCRRVLSFAGPFPRDRDGVRDAAAKLRVEAIGRAQAAAAAMALSGLNPSALSKTSMKPGMVASRAQSRWNSQ